RRGDSAQRGGYPGVRGPVLPRRQRLVHSVRGEGGGRGLWRRLPRLSRPGPALDLGGSSAQQRRNPFDRAPVAGCNPLAETPVEDRKSTRLNSSHVKISYAV